MDNRQAFNLNKELDVESMIKCILSEIENYSSDSDTVRFEVKFIKMTKNEKTSKTELFEKVDREEVVIESVDDFRVAPDGAFFPFINLLEGLDLTRYQI